MRQPIYRSNTLHAFSVYPESLLHDRVIICFQNRADNLTLDSPGFGESFFRKNGTAGIYVNCCSNSWWQYEDLKNCLSALRSATSGFGKRITYGSSMGGYAAIRFADVVGADAVISACPQYSPRREVVSLESRYERDIKGIPFFHEDGLGQFANIPRYLLFDPYMAVDKAHALRYISHGHVTLVPMPAAGHPCLPLLADQGILADVLTKMCGFDFDVSSFVVDQHRRRRATYRYYDQMSYRLAERGRLRLAALFAEKAASVFPENADNALSLALKWSLYKGDIVRAGLITSRITANYPEAVKLWSIANNRRQSHYPSV